MTSKEFSDGFDVLLNSYGSKWQFGTQSSVSEIVLDEYEKSLFLTKSQEKLVTTLYNGKNSFGESFESTEEMRRYLSNIVEESQVNPIVTTSGMPLGVDSSSKFFTLPEDLWFITYESVTISDGECDSKTTLDVMPVTQDEYHKIKRNPFRGANKRRALRLDLSDGVVEIVSNYTISKYYVRYLRKPYPIILEVLPDGLTIDEKTSPKSTDSPCELHEALHQKILEGAVMMALQSRYGSSASSKT